MRSPSAAPTWRHWLRTRFPSGKALPAEAWERRHRGILILIVVHAVGLAGFGLLMGAGPLHSLFEGGIILAFGLAAAIPAFERRARSIIAAMGLMSSSAVLTHLSGGYIEAHFHFFVMLGIIFLYEDWVPYVLAVGYVALHHGIAGSIDPRSVYNHPEAITHPWQWAGVHALFILGLSACLIVAWNAIEQARLSETRALREAQEFKRALHTQEKMAALGSLAAGLAHEVRTPLTVLATSANLIELEAKRAPGNPLAASVLANTSEINANVDRINALVLQLRKFHSLAPDERKPAALHSVVHEALRLFSTVDKSGRVIKLDLAPTGTISIHPLGIQQVVLNLVGNAVEATESTNGSVTIETRAEKDSVLLVVSDEGTGMSAEARRKAFDPFYTTKKDGMGLGLHIVRRIVEQHHGTIEIHSSPGKGTRIVVRLPGTPALESPATPLRDKTSAQDAPSVA